MSLKPFEERFLYKVITNDCSVNQNEEVDERLMAIAFADFDLILDASPLDRRTLNEKI